MGIKSDILNTDDKEKQRRALVGGFLEIFCLSDKDAARVSALKEVKNMYGLDKEPARPEDEAVVYKNLADFYKSQK